MNLAKLKTVLMDGDGVIWRGNEAVPGALAFLDLLQQRGMDWALLTNNNTRTVADFVAKLRGFGIDADASRVLTSSTVTADYLLERYGPGAPVHAVGMEGLTVTLAEAGFDISCGETPPDHPVVAVAAGMDRAITYDKIRVAMRLILNGAEFVATNTDRAVPSPEGLLPATGMVIAMLQAVTSVTPTILGKPERPIYQAALKRFNAEVATTIMVGDQLETDILGAQQMGMASAAILTGVVTRAELAQSPIQPDLIYADLDEMAAALRAA
jgi:4-nitrophenyl phosphatase